MLIAPNTLNLKLTPCNPKLKQSAKASSFGYPAVPDLGHSQVSNIRAQDPWAGFPKT